MLRRGITCKTAQTAQEARGVAYTLTTCSPAAEAAEVAAAAAEGGGAGLAVPPPRAPPPCCPIPLTVLDPFAVVTAPTRVPPGQRCAEEAAELQERRAPAHTHPPPWLQLCLPPAGSPTALAECAPAEQLAPDPTAALADEQTALVSSAWRGGGSAARVAADARGAEHPPEDVPDRLHAPVPGAGWSAAKTLAYQEVMAAGAVRAVEARQAPAILEALHGMIPTPQVLDCSSSTRHRLLSTHHCEAGGSDCPCSVASGLKA